MNIIQLQFFKVKDTCHILKISTKTYYIVQRSTNKDDEVSSSARIPPNVSKKDEEALLSKLEAQQSMGDCFSRKWLEEYFKEQGRDVELDKCWLYRFKKSPLKK